MASFGPCERVSDGGKERYSPSVTYAQEGLNDNRYVPLSFLRLCLKRDDCFRLDFRYEPQRLIRESFCIRK